MLYLHDDMTFIEFFIKYSNFIGFATLLIPIGVFAATYYVRNKLFTNSSKVRKVDARTLEQKASQDIIGIDEITMNMFINHDSQTHSGVIATTGIPYPILPEAEKNAVNAGYISFLSSINFPFSKHIMSRKIDIDATEKIYAAPLDKKYAEIDFLSVQISNLLGKQNSHGLSEREENELKRNQIRKNKLDRDIEYIKVQQEYLEQVTSNIQGTSKFVYYATSASLDAEALKGSTEEQEYRLYADNLSDRLHAMSNSLSSIGVVADRLRDVELLDLARTHYKPMTSSIYKTKDIIKESGVESDYYLNPDIYARIKVHTALSKEGVADV